MLQQIIKEMYVDPDILEELPQEQKEILFFHIRQEQVSNMSIMCKKKRFSLIWMVF